MLMSASLCSNGQHVTANRDSVKIPLRWFRAASADLERYDDCKKETAILKESNENLRRLSDKNTEFANDLQERNKQLDLRVKEAMAAGELAEAKNKEAIAAMQKQLRKQRTSATLKGIGGTLAGVAAGIAIMFLIK